MKRFFSRRVLSAVACGLLLWLGPAQARRLALAPGDTAPELSGKTPHDTRETIDYAQTQLTLVNFWATWCEPCKLEMPELNRLYERLSSSGLNVVGVHGGYVEEQALREFVKALEVAYTILIPDKKVYTAWGGIGVLPTSFLVDHEGRILRRYVGSSPVQVEGLLQDIDDALNGRALGPMPLPEDPTGVTLQDSKRSAEGS
jgi:thiol-disulfide isomerase/thioredoxin